MAAVYLTVPLALLLTPFILRTWRDLTPFFLTLTAETLVAGGTRHWFHRADCRLAASRGWPAASRSAHEAAGRRACPACKP